MSPLETQLQASIDIIELRKRDSSTLAAVIKAAQAELQARKVKLRSDVADLAKQKKALQRTAAELHAAGVRARGRDRAVRKDKGTKRGSKGRASLYAVIPEDMMAEQMELNALDRNARLAAEDAECADADARDDYERQNAARGNEP